VSLRPLVAAGAVALAAVATASASAAPLAVGVFDGADRAATAAQVAAATGGSLTADLGPLDALVFDVSDPVGAAPAARAVPGVEYAEAVTASRSLAWEPNDPLVPGQWYLRAIRAFDAWPEIPALPPVRVAVVDSGIDAGHPEFAGRIAAMRSFVSSPAGVDAQGHGTTVAGAIAAGADNAEGIAGVGVPVELLVAKVVDARGQISLLAEARAIRWAVDNGARVINLSLGGTRDPRNPQRDTYSRLEHAAIDYATRRGVVVVAAAGNCASLSCPEPYASWPAALPHVIGVGALGRDGSSPAFSNRDRLHVDLAAPGLDILSTYPRALAAVAGCGGPGYTLCANDPSRRHPRGTSFAAPLVSAAAAVALAERERLGHAALHGSQVPGLLRATAADLGARGRDARSGHGLVDVAAAAGRASAPPPRDRFEANDDAGSRAYTLRGAKREVEATLDRYDDVRDVYRVFVSKGQVLRLALTGPAGGNSALALWRPGTRAVTGTTVRRADRVSASAHPGSRERITFRARGGGWYFVEARLASGRSGAYRLEISKAAR
jgi:subtilisin family serine protease